jgi:hypothetical protein|tara:strand:- start:248 stop:385 length:138 start_codon:yes stop_codon:yes gene_type:complete
MTCEGERVCSKCSYFPVRWFGLALYGCPPGPFFVVDVKAPAGMAL